VPTPAEPPNPRGVSFNEEVRTPRLIVRPAVEDDRERFVDLFGDTDFMVFSGPALDVASANFRFDHMLEVAREIPFAKRPIIERSSGLVIGYTGVDWFDLGDQQRLEFGYRLTSAARGRGYATEASRALLVRHAVDAVGTYAIIHQENIRSQNVIKKLGFEFLRLDSIEGEPRRLYILRRVRPTGAAPFAVGLSRPPNA
jgi:RimJ/RimL family protein N-acetyltransferase